MKRLLSSFIFITLFLVATATDTAAYRINLQPFNSLTVVDGVAVECVCRPDSAGWAVFYATPDKASQIMFENKAEHLTIRSSADETPIPGLPKVRVYTATLNKIENSGDSLLAVSGLLKGDNIKIRQIGNGAISIARLEMNSVDAGITAGKGQLFLGGKTGRAKYHNVSSGAIEAADLESQQTVCYIFGTGDIYCNAAVQLRIYGAGSGKVYYSGKPQKITNRGIGVKAVAY